MSRPIDDLVTNVLQTRYDALNRDVVESATKRIIDVMGCGIAGAGAPTGQIVLDLARDWGGKEESSTFHGDRMPAHNAAMVNSVMARAFDYEVSGLNVEGKLIPSHIAGTTVPVAFAMAERKRATGKELITALVVGDDVAARVHAASDFAFELGWDPTGTVNAIGATAIAGRLLQLDSHQMLNAFGIVLNQLGGSFQCVWDRVHSFNLHQGLSARNGIVSAELASKGFTGAKDPLLSSHGFFALFSKTSHPDILTRDLGKRFYADVRFKPYPSCGGNDAPIDCALEIARNHEIGFDDIADVVLDVTPWARDGFEAVPFDVGEYPPADAIFSYQYNVANALLRKSVRLEHFTEKFIRQPDIVALAKRVRITGNIPPEKGRRAATVMVRTKDGKEFSAHVDAPRGDPIDKPLTRVEIMDKFRACVSFSGKVREKDARLALTMLDNLEDVDDIGGVFKLLT